MWGALRYECQNIIVWFHWAWVFGDQLMNTPLVQLPVGEALHLWLVAALLVGIGKAFSVND